MSESKPDLEKLRQNIDQIDQQIQDMINKRASYAQQVADVKQESASDGEKAVFYRPEREAQVLRKVMNRNQGPLDNESMARLFREIMSVCLALEEPMNIAYLGPEGTFTQAAAQKHFGHAVKTSPLATIDEVFREVESGSAHYGVVPVENSTEGMVNTTLDSFIHSTLTICGEVELRIHHNLLVGSNTRQESITRIYSHQQSLAQCRQWLDAHYPNADRVAVSSNSEAARRLQSEWNAAAIAGEVAAEIYDLQKLATNIEDNPHNTTRFLIVGREHVPASGEDKTSVIVSMKNKPGALYELLAPFYDAGIMLTRVETRPSRDGTWTYLFFIDFEGHESDAQIKGAMGRVEQIAVYLKKLGSYPKAVL
ncbi:prephenate dehydratase [Ketobacter sp. MCCC 1A13808]|uniref:prephenate dehydratase n=1 Tax=Ketobacter sp. MCCC 1A13808 TaxID=2602738 RepID=UPI000F170C4A|nr:prephenate dehydratase [Ketobacter sp. MCCC 1A13808]MVF12888.1 prephenate dehydratase [Ketobacter sp. MCCC 1A13808]RLP54439.1 MAG: prephenate dehydratase [Ketobacter sp.]